MEIFKRIIAICAILVHNHNNFLSVSCSDYVVQKWRFKSNANGQVSGIQFSLDVIQSIQGLESETECVRACVSHYLEEKEEDRCQNVQFKKSSGACELLGSEDSEQGWSPYKLTEYSIAPFVHLETDHLLTSIEGGMKIGMIITISGVIDQDARGIYINFHLGPSTDVDVALNFWVEFGSDNELRLSTITDAQPISYHQMTKEEFPFTLGEGFRIKIIAETTQFKISVDGKHLADYVYRKPLNEVGSIDAMGDFTLNVIRIQ